MYDSPSNASVNNINDSHNVVIESVNVMNVVTLQIMMSN